MENNMKELFEGFEEVEVLEVNEATALPETGASSVVSSCDSSSCCGSSSCCS